MNFIMKNIKPRIQMRGIDEENTNTNVSIDVVNDT